MSVKTRIIVLICGIAFSIVGALLTYYEFFGKRNNAYGNSGYFPLGTLITGIVLVIMAFEKKNKVTDGEIGPKSKKPQQ